MRKIIRILASHGLAMMVGFALGVYFLPILTAAPAPDRATLTAMSANAMYTGTFTRDLRGSDFLHWGEGKVSLSPERIVHDGALAPGPDYKMYLTSAFVEHEDEFLPVKASAALVGDVKSFGGIVVDVPPGVDISAYTTVVIWCEAFGEFITAARYRE